MIGCLSAEKRRTMPVKIKKKRGKYEVYTPSGTKGKGMTLRNAKRQVRLLNAIDHGWKPTKKRGKRYARD